MNQSKPQAIASSEALFRFRIACKVLTRVARGEVQAQVVACVSKISHAQLDGCLLKVSARTLYRWLAAYQRGGLATLEPAGAGLRGTPGCAGDIFAPGKGI